MSGKTNELNAFDLYIEGEHQINAEVLSNILLNISKLTEIIADEQGVKNDYKLNVTALKKGSFGIFFNFDDIKNGIEMAASIISCIVGVFELKKFLEGKQPRQVNEINNREIEVQNCSKKINTFPKSCRVIIDNKNADYHISMVSNNIKIHNPKGGFTISSQNRKINYSFLDVENISVNITSNIDMIAQNDFDRYVNIDLIEGGVLKLKSENTIIDKFNANLIIKKPDILENTPWEFLLDNKKIRAKILDQEWLSSIQQKSLVLKPGCYIYATVQASYKKDKYGNTIGKATYKVIKVHGKIKNKNTN